MPTSSPRPRAAVRREPLLLSRPGGSADAGNPPSPSQGTASPQNPPLHPPRPRIADALTICHTGDYAIQFHRCHRTSDRRRFRLVQSHRPRGVGPAVAIGGVALRAGVPGGRHAAKSTASTSRPFVKNGRRSRPLSATTSEPPPPSRIPLSPEVEDSLQLACDRLDFLPRRPELATEHLLLRLGRRPITRWPPGCGSRGSTPTPSKRRSVASMDTTLPGAFDEEVTAAASPAGPHHSPLGPPAAPHANRCSPRVGRRRQSRSRGVAGDRGLRPLRVWTIRI